MQACGAGHPYGRNVSGTKSSLRSEAIGGKGYALGPVVGILMGIVRQAGREVHLSDSGDTGVKLVIAIIQPSKLNAVREALEKIEVGRMTICDALGYGRQFGQEPAPGEDAVRPTADAPAVLLRKIVLEVVVNDDFLDRTIETISGVARTGSEGTIGDGKIFIVPAEVAVQVNDGRRGLGAV